MAYLFYRWWNWASEKVRGEGLSLGEPCWKDTGTWDLDCSLRHENNDSQILAVQHPFPPNSTLISVHTICSLGGSRHPDAYLHASHWRATEFYPVRLKGNSRSYLPAETSTTPSQQYLLSRCHFFFSCLLLIICVVLGKSLNNLYLRNDVCKIYQHS